MILSILFLSLILPFLCLYYGAFKKDAILYNSDILGYYGAVIGGVVTVLGVYWTLKHESEKSKEEKRESSLPIFTFSIHLNSENKSNSYHNIGSFVFGENLRDKFKVESDRLFQRLKKYSTEITHLKDKIAKDDRIARYTSSKESRKEINIKLNTERSELKKLNEDFENEFNKQEICNLNTSFILSINNIGLKPAILSTIKFVPKGIMSPYNESEIINLDYLSVPKGETTRLKVIFDWYLENQNGLSTKFQEAGDLELKYTDLYSNPYEYVIPIKINRVIAQDQKPFVQFNIIIDKEQLPVRPKGYS